MNFGTIHSGYRRVASRPRLRSEAGENLEGRLGADGLFAGGHDPRGVTMVALRAPSVTPLGSEETPGVLPWHVPPQLGADPEPGILIVVRREKYLTSDI